MAGGAYPRFYDAVVDMVVGEAKETRMARSIARKAGLRGITDAYGGAPATLIDATLPADFAPLEWQFKVDLSGYSRLRLDARSADYLHVYYSLAGNASDVLNPGDYAPLPGTYNDDGGSAGGLIAKDTDGQVGEPLWWLDMDAGPRELVRLCFVGSGTVGGREDLAGPVGVFLQAE